MYLKKIKINNYGPLKDFEYESRFNENNEPVPIVMIGKNGSGKSLILSNIIDAIVEVKREFYSRKIYEVKDTNYYKMGNKAYISNGKNTSIVDIEFILNNKSIFYKDVMSNTPELAIERGEVVDNDISNNVDFKQEGFCRKVNIFGLTHNQFEDDILLYFPFDRYYKPLWINPNNFSKFIYDFFDVFISHIIICLILIFF